MDFTNCRRIITKAYSGANGKKIAIEIEKKQYMINYLSEIQKKFYKYYISQRYDKILKRVYEKYTNKIETT